MIYQITSFNFLYQVCKDERRGKRSDILGFKRTQTADLIMFQLSSNNMAGICALDSAAAPEVKLRIVKIVSKYSE